MALMRTKSEEMVNGGQFEKKKRKSLSRGREGRKGKVEGEHKQPMRSKYQRIG